MSVFDQFAKVRAAQRRMTAARQELSPPAAALLARGHAHPLTTMGVAAGAGFVLGSLNVHPLRVPGVGPLLSGGLADAVAFGTRMIAELGASGLASTGQGRGESGVHDVEDGEPS